MKKIIALSGPSGSGKSTLAKIILEKYRNFEFSVSATTRNPRQNEVDGKHYYFITVEDFKEKIKKSELIEYEEVYPNIFYGTLFSEIDRIIFENKVPLLDIDVYGSLNIKKKFPESLIVFVHPGSIETLEKRLVDRNTDNQKVIEVRIKKATEEIELSKEFDFILNNDVELEESSKVLCRFIDKYLQK